MLEVNVMCKTIMEKMDKSLLNLLDFGVPLLKEPNGKEAFNKLIEETAAELAEYRKITDKYTAKQTEEIVKGLIRDITREDFERSFPKGGRDGFTVYVTKRITDNVVVFLLEQKRRGLRKKILKWVEEYAIEVYPAPYGKTLQGVMLNQIRQIGKRAGLNSKTENDTIIYDTENVKLAFFKSSKYKGAAMTTPMQKVLSMYHEELCKILPNVLEELGQVTFDELGHYSKARITLEKYMNLTKTKDKKTARQAIKEACDRLYEISFIVTVKKGKTAKTYKGRLFQSQVVTYRGGIYEMEFSNDFLRYCSTTTPAAFHHAMYQINGQYNPYAWGLGQKLRQHYELNRGKKNANIISILKLIEAVPDIPTYEEVSETTGAVNRRIIEPVERDLDVLQKLGVLKFWERCNSKGVALTKGQLDNMDYNEWVKQYVAFDLDLPPQEKYIEAHKKKIEAAKKKAAAREKAKTK